MDETKKKRLRCFRRILWAVDPLCWELDLEAHSAGLLRELSESNSSTVEPIHVLRPGQLDPLEFVFQESAQLSLQARERLVGFWKGLKFPARLPPRFLFAEGASLREAVQVLVDYVYEKSADLVVLNTHGRKGVPRLFLGSFAESLVFASPVPVLVTNPKAHVSAPIHPIIFPTDFSAQSKEVFESALALAQSLHTGILLYHKAEIPVAEVPYLFGYTPLAPLSLEALYEDVREEVEAWTRHGREQGVRVEFHLVQHAEELVQNLIRVAEAHPSALIALASESGPVATALLGSVTRKILREAPCPVFVLHPQRPRRRAHENLWAHEKTLFTDAR